MVTPLHRKLFRDIGRHKAQFIAVTITMFLGVTIFGATYDSFQNLQASYASTATEYRFANLTVHGGDVNGVVQEAANIPTVESFEVRTVADLPFQVGDVKLLGRIVGVPAAGQPEVNELKVVRGSYLDPADPNGVLVEQHMADHFNLAIGDTVDVLSGSSWTQVTVRGVVSSPEYIWPARNRQEIITSPDNFGVIFPSADLASTLAPQPNNEAVFYYTGGNPDAQVSDQLKAKAYQLGATDIYTRAEQPSNAGLSEDLKGFEEMAVFFPMMFLLAAAMAAYVMISRLVHTQRPHIGVFIANGFTRGQVLRHYLGYGLVPGLIGSIPGAVAGILLARAITRLYTDMLAVPVTLVQFYPTTLLGAIAFGLVASLLAALAPALVASRVQPAAAMRGETPSGGGRLSLLERLIPPLRRMPVSWRMAVRGVGRNPRRTTYTIIGVVLSLMLVLVSWGMIDTINHLMNRQFVEVQREDATVYFTQSVSTAEVPALQDVPGVARAEPALTLGVSLAAGNQHYETSLLVLENDTQMHRFPTVNGDWIGLPDQGLVVGKAVEGLLDVKVGDELTVTATGGITFHEPIAAFVDEPFGTMAYIARDRAGALTGTQLPATSALVSYAPGADSAQLRRTLTNRPEIAAFEDAKALYSTMQQYMVLFYTFVGVMLVFGAAMAFALIFNAMSVNIAERTREVATLLAVGTDRRRISRSITTENLLVVLMGIPLGLVVGYFASKAALDSFSSDRFAFDLYVRPTTFVWAAVAMVVVALVSQWPGLRAVRRINIPEVVKERSA